MRIYIFLMKSYAAVFYKMHKTGKALVHTVLQAIEYYDTVLFEV